MDGEKSLNLDLIYENSKLNNEKHELLTSLKLEYEVEILNQYNFKLAFKVGQKRMYRIADLIEFYKAYKNEKELTYVAIRSCL